MLRRLLHADLSLLGLLVFLGVLLALWLLTLLWPLVLLLVIASMFAAALVPVVDWLTRHHLPRSLAVLLLVLALLLIIGLFGLLIGPVILRQAHVVVERVPDLRAQVAQFLERRGAPDAARRVASFSPTEFQGSLPLLSSARGVVSGVTGLVTVVLLTAYLLFDAPRILQFVDFATPAHLHIHIHRILADLRMVVGGYIRGQLITSVLAMVVGFALFTAVGIPNAVALAVLGGMTDIIPIIGVYLFVLPSAVAALSVSVLAAVTVVVVLFAYQELESRVLVQRIYGQTLRLPAVVVVVALLVGADLQGIVGALLALPAAAAIRVLVEYGNEVREARRAHRQPPVGRA